MSNEELYKRLLVELIKSGDLRREIVDLRTQVEAGQASIRTLVAAIQRHKEVNQE